MAASVSHRPLREGEFARLRGGLVAEWLRSGLQIRAPQFDSGPGLQCFNNVADRAPGRATYCRLGRRMGAYRAARVGAPGRLARNELRFTGFLWPSQCLHRVTLPSPLA